MTASNYSGNAYLDCFLRGVAPTPPTQLWVSLHTADPGATGASEADTGTWPAYARQDAAAGGAIGAAFTAASSKLSHSAHDLLWAAYDGTGTIVITHWALWDAATGGNCIDSGKFVSDPDDVSSTAAPKTLGVGDEIAVYAGEIGVKVA